MFAVLKARGWATQLSAGEGGASFSGRSFLEVRVLLTKEGATHSPPRMPRTAVLPACRQLSGS